MGLLMPAKVRNKEQQVEGEPRQAEGKAQKTVAT